MNLQSISIIVTCEEQQSQLRQLLPSLLSQRYGGEYEVIVVDKMHDKDLGEWLEEMEVHNPHLSHTFCSTTARGIDVHKLALTLGAKAANYEWLVIPPVDAKSVSDDWLASLTSNVDGQADVVVVVTNSKRRWNWFKSIFRRTYPLFRPTSSIILCRRSVLLRGQVVKLSNCKIIKP